MSNPNYAKLKKQIQETAVRCGRNPAEILLLAVTKEVGVMEIIDLHESGCRDFGENRVPVLEEKYEFFKSKQGHSSDRFLWHFIGPIQRNKVRRIVEMADVIHSGESLPVLKAIDRICGELKRRRKVLVEVNIGGEENKHGFQPAELEAAWPEIQALQNIEMAGFMGMTALNATEKEAHEQFALLRSLRDSYLPGGQLSMGMSHDFQIAIEEGATIVRIGTALYEGIERF